MEQEEQELITKHLSALTTFTICKEPLLTFMQEKKILGFADIDFITATQEETTRACRFYDIIRRRLNAYPILLEGLNKTNQREIVEFLATGILPKGLSTEKRTHQLFGNDVNPILFDIISPDILFSGRSKELEILNQKINNCRKNPDGICAIVICGLGGIGKSQLCRKYIQMYKRDFRDTVIWMNAETESSLSQSFAKLSEDILNISTKNFSGAEKDITIIVNDIYKYFEKRKCLFIFDNVEKFPNLAKFLPLSRVYPDDGQYPTLIMTSRETEWELAVQIVKIKELEKGDVISMLQKGLDKKHFTGDVEINKLIDNLQCYPLVIRQAISYIREQSLLGYNYTIENYIQDFQNSQKEMLSFNDSADCTRLTNDYSMTTFTTFKVTTQRLFKKSMALTFFRKMTKQEMIGKTALQILDCMGYLLPDGINRNTLRLFAYENVDEVIFREAMRLLLKYSLIDADDNRENFNVHRMVQNVTRISISLEHRENEVLSILLNGLSSKLEGKNLDHTILVWKYSNDDIRKQFCHIPATILQKLVDSIRYTERVRFGKCALADLEKLVEGHKFWFIGGRAQNKMENEVTRLTYELGIGLHSAEKHEEALVLFQALLRRHLKMHNGADHMDISNDYLWMARCLSFIGKSKDALEYFRKAKEGFKRLGADISWVEYSVGVLHGRIGSEYSLKIAVHTLKNCLQMKLNYGGREKLKFRMRTSLMLGNYLVKQGNLTEAREILTENLEREREWSGEDFVAFNGSSRYLADILRMEKKYEEAFISHDKIYKLRTSLFGEHDLRTLFAKQDVAVDLHSLNKYNDSLKYFQEVHDSLSGECALEDSHWQILQCQEGIADNLVKLNKVQKALEVYRQVVTKRKLYFGADHVETQNLMQKIFEIESKMNIE